MKKLCLILLLTLSLISFGIALAFSQDEPVQQPTQPAAKEEVQAEKNAWGEVINLDPANKMILVKDFDYETEQFKEVPISVDENTVYENIKSIEELKQSDEVSVDYVTTPSGKNIAKFVSLEKPESAATSKPETAPAVQTEGAAENATAPAAAQ